MYVLHLLRIFTALLAIHLIGIVYTQLLICYTLIVVIN
jgi:hypothetical protein